MKHQLTTKYEQNACHIICGNLDLQTNAPIICTSCSSMWEM